MLGAPNMDAATVNNASPGVALQPADLIYGLDEKPPLRLSLFVALQHVLAVFVGIVTPRPSSHASSGYPVRTALFW
jgi:xanthine/uracil permease